MKEPLDELLLAYTRHEATEEQLRELAASIDADPAVAQRVSDEVLMDGLFRAEADPGFVAETAAAVGVRPDDAAFVAGTMHRIEARRMTRRRATAPQPFAYGAVAAAAIVVIAFGLLLWSSVSPQEPHKARQTPVALPKVVPAPVEPPKAPQPLPAPVPIPAPKAPETPLPVPVPAPSPLVPPPVVPPPPPPPAPAPAPDVTVTAIAKLDRVAGDVQIIGGESPVRARKDADLPPGRGIVTGDGDAFLKFADDTVVVVHPNTRISEIVEDHGNRFRLDAGSVSAIVARQTLGKQFTISTRHGSAIVLGTVLHLKVDEMATRLDVDEGKVRFIRASDKKSVDVSSGRFTTSDELTARSIEGFTLKDIPAQGLALWLRADAGTDEGRARVRTWFDQSGNKRHAEQTDVTKRPQLVANALRHRPAIRFDGKDDALTVPLPIEGQTGLTLVLVSANSTDALGGPVHGENAALFWPETAEWGWVYLTPFQSNVRFRFGTTQQDNLPFFIRASTVKDFTLTTVVKDGPVESLYIQGVLAERYTGKLPAIKGTQPVLQIGLGAGGKAFAGDIAEILVYGRALPDLDRVRLERAIIGKYFGNR